MSTPEFKPAFLYVERGPGAGQLLEVKQGSVIVGRASISDLRLQHPSISRRHCQIKRQGETYFVKDLGSQNGTFVNKQRIATEVEVKVGDHIAMGNALIRLRGPMLKGEKIPSAKSQPAMSAAEADSKTLGVQALKVRQATAVVARPSGSVRVGSNALKIAVFAGAVGFGLAAALGFALLKTMTSGSDQTEKVDKRAAASKKPVSDREKLIQEAISRKMQEKKAEKADEPGTVEPATVEAGAVVVKQDRQEPPSVTRVAAAHPATPRFAVATKKARPEASDEDTEPATAAPAKGNAKRLQILAPYEKGNAEASLELAKKLGDKDLADKLMKFIQTYDAANDAMMSNNGNAAIANFQKALKLDEELSSGWGKYGGEIRKQLANLYVLVGMQFASNGEDEKAKTAFQAALKHDPGNSRAKAQLEKLSGGPKNPDDAFNEGSPTAAPEKKAPAKKEAPKSIDDAFGD